MIVWILAFILCLIGARFLVEPYKNEWVWVTFLSALISAIIAFGAAGLLLMTHPATVPAHSTNIALTTIAGNYYAVGHVDEENELHFTMINGDDYTEISCPNQTFSRVNAPKSDTYLEIREMKYASHILRLLFLNFADDTYVLHAPQNAVLLDVPY